MHCTCRLFLYFTIVWTVTFYSFYRFSQSKKYGAIAGGYDKAVTQAFTAGSNNFELAIAIAVASFGNDAPEALAATLGPLIEVPVLLVLSYVALYVRDKLDWGVMNQNYGGARDRAVDSEAGEKERAITEV